MSEKQLKKIKFEDLIPKNYRKPDIKEIKESLLSSGQKESITVTPEIKDGKETGKFIIVNGNRRYHAVESILKSNEETKFDFSSIDCVIDREYDPEKEGEAFKLNQLIFNEVHKSTNYETYIAIHELVKSGKYKKSEISKALGKSDNYAGMISNLMIDDDMFISYLSGEDCIYDGAKRKAYKSFNDFEENNKEYITDQDLSRLQDFRASDERSTAKFEKENDVKIFEHKELSKVVIYKGLGVYSPPSLYACQSIANFYHGYCVTHDRKAEAIKKLHDALKAFMLKEIKSQTIIEQTMKSIITKYFEGKPEPVKTYTPKDVAKKIFNLFKDVTLTPEEVKQVKQELKAILKSDKNRDRLGVNIIIKAKVEED